MGGTPLMADLFLFCYEWDVMMSLSEEKQSEVIEVIRYTVELAMSTRLCLL